MGRIICFDFGLKRVGVAVTDELKIISTPYDTFPASKVFNLISEYLSKNTVDIFVVGLPYDLKGRETDATKKTLDLETFIFFDNTFEYFVGCNIKKAAP